MGRGSPIKMGKNAAVRHIYLKLALKIFNYSARRTKPTKKVRGKVFWNGPILSCETV
jgi:hypothetical protein